MEPTRVSRLLEEWNAVANHARRPAAPPRGVVVGRRLPSATLTGAGFIAVALVLASVLLSRQDPNNVGGVTPPPSVNPTAAPTPTAAPAIDLCGPENVTAQITMWEGAAGHRIADVELTNAGSGACTLPAVAKPQLLDGNGEVLIDGSSPTSSQMIELAPSAVLRTLVQAGNYCGPDPAPPVSVAFVLSDGGSIVADPVSPTDVTVPPCLGPSGSAGTIEMQPWAP
jgi:uncharacterized protein DUF4232